MNTDTTFASNDETLVTDEEIIEDVKNLRAQISKLSGENDNYRQELHESHRKLEISKNMETELSELNRALEQSLEDHAAQSNRRTQEIEEKHIAQKVDLQERLCNVEAELTRLTEENRDLRQTIKINDERLMSLNQSQYSMCADDNSELLKSQIEEISELLAQEEEIRKQREETIQAMERDSQELRQILAVTKSQLVEKNELTESMRGELLDCRMELESLKTTPATDKSKGNSLFAEVEDRRKMTLGQMTAMRNSYLEAKRSFQAKEAEIRSLKAERALLLRKWEDDTVEKIQQDASLVDKYKARIGELETRLKEEQKKQKQTTKIQQSPENDFAFLQSLVETKSKKIEELSTKIENNSIKAILDEEKKHKMGKQLRYWRYRAMSGEAELVSIKNRLESDPSSSNVEILETIKNRLIETSKEPNETFMGEKSQRETTFVNETVVNLETLVTMPKTSIQTEDVSLSLFESTVETSESLKFSSDESIIIREKIIKTEHIEASENKFESPNSGKTIKIDSSEEIDESDLKDSKIREIVESRKFEQSSQISNKSTSKIEKANEKYSNNDIIAEPVLKSMLIKTNDEPNLILSGKDKNEKDKKTLRFTADTIDPPSKTLKKQPTSAPKYPIVFISSGKSKK